jgi:hypothetical protein
MPSRRTLLGIHLPIAIIVAAVSLNLATGARVFTSLPNSDLARMQSYESAIDAVFRDPVPADQQDEQSPTAAPTPIDNAFHFGWLPSGLSLGGLSVLTFAFPSVVVLGATLLAPRRKPRTPNSNN